MAQTSDAVKDLGKKELEKFRPQKLIINIISGATAAAISKTVVTPTQPVKLLLQGQEALIVDEDEQGNISIGGTELSFQTWGQLNRASEPGVVCSAVVLAEQHKLATPEKLGSRDFSAEMEEGEIEEEILKSPMVEKEDGEISDSDSDPSDTYYQSGKSRENSSSSDIQRLFKEIYAYRFKVVEALSVQQKFSLLNIIKSSQPETSC